MSSVQPTWRFLDTGRGSAMFNMALDRAIFDSVIVNETPRTIRLFQWEHESITIGFSQQADRILDTGKCIRDGIETARRPTGGRAVYHCNEVAYSVAAHIDDPYFGGSITDTFRAVSEVLCRALGKIGVEASLSAGKPAHSAAGSPVPCFLSTSRYELTAGGKKLAGSAQRRIGASFLQQGSILVGPGHEKIAGYMKDTARAGIYKRLLPERAITIEEAYNGTVPVAVIENAIREAFADTLHEVVATENPTAKETEAARKSMDTFNALKGCDACHEQ